MINFTITSILLGALCFTPTGEKDAKEILKKSYEKCQAVENGYYEMEYHMKYMDGNDTTTSEYKCYFQKLPEDTLYSFAFHYQRFSDGEYKRDYMYTGEEFVDYSTNDSSGTIMAKDKWADKIEANKHSYRFYTPLTDHKSRPIPSEKKYSDSSYIFKLAGETVVNGIPCYHVKINNLPDPDSTNTIEILKAEWSYWISKKDYIPIQYSTAMDIVIMGDTMHQYQKNVLKKYELDNLQQKEQLQLSSIPSFIGIKEYEPYNRPALLARDTIAPNWALPDLNGDTINLSDFKGELVLIDFFYKACYPCRLAIPALQELHEKYKDKGLKVVGIDPYDTKEEDEIDVFLKKQGVTYTVVLGGKDVAKKYNVSGYPTLYLLNKQGKVLFSQSGYGEGTEAAIEEVIKEHL